LTRPHRAFLAVLLSLLLVAMQSEGLRHALAHQAAALTTPDGQSLVVPTDAPCLECRLLVGGANAITGGPPSLLLLSSLPVLVVLLPRFTPQSAPSYYRSRAPPSLL